MALNDVERKLVKDALALIERETATDGERLVIKGFGTFTRKHVAARMARNLKTGAPVPVAARSVLRFKPSDAQVRVEP